MKRPCRQRISNNISMENKLSFHFSKQLADEQLLSISREGKGGNFPLILCKGREGGLVLKGIGQPPV